MHMKILQAVETIYLSAGIAHFLNCLLSSCAQPKASNRPEELVMKKKRRSKKEQEASSPPAWAALTPKALWAQIRLDLKVRGDSSYEND